MNRTRVFWCLVYVVIASVLLLRFLSAAGPVVQDGLSFHLRHWVWAAAWGALGIGLSLYTSRFEGESRHSHYLTYFVFLWGVAIFSGLAVSGLRGGPQPYLLSALTAIVVGFSGDSLAGIVDKLSGWTRPRPPL